MMSVRVDQVPNPVRSLSWRKNGVVAAGVGKEGGGPGSSFCYASLRSVPHNMLRHSRGFHYEGGRIRRMPARDERPVYTPDRCTAALCLFVSFSLLLGLMRGTGRSTGGSDPMCVEAPWGIVGGVP